jgi:hypothetical protein
MAQAKGDYLLYRSCTEKAKVSYLPCTHPAERQSKHGRKLINKIIGINNDEQKERKWQSLTLQFSNVFQTFSLFQRLYAEVGVKWGGQKPDLISA